MIYRKLKRTWTHGYANHIPNFDKVFPELDHLGSEELCDRFIKLGLDFYTEKKTPISPWVRLTLPFALLTWLLMFVSLPINFIITGQWGYSLEGSRIYNWMKQLRIQ